MNDKLTITLNIAGRPCVLTIEREEEEEIRKAAQLINSKIAKYRENPQNGSYQPYNQGYYSL